MVITKTPFRVSFFGGGTDIPAWFKEEGGQVLSTSIDKYCYVTARNLPPFFKHSIRLAYSKIETVSNPLDIEHPLVRAILDTRGENNLEIHYDADLPGRSGLGSSSSFGVGLVSALDGLKGKLMSKKDMADQIIHFERNVLQEHGGHQDQVAAAFGGFNQIKFNIDGSYSVNPVVISEDKLTQLKSSLVLCYVPIERLSSDISLAKDFDKNACEQNLRDISSNVDSALKILKDGELDDFGSLLDMTWKKKRDFKGVTNPEIDHIYQRAISAGALGGKLLGAGGGGFMIFYCKPEKQAALKKALKGMLFVPFDFESNGSQVIYYQN